MRIFQWFERILNDFPKNGVDFGERFWEEIMRKITYKGRCEKQKLSKCIEVCRTYDKVQAIYAQILDASDEIGEIRCNVVMEGYENGLFSTDFVCTKTNGDLMVRECTYRKLLILPRTMRLLDDSRKYWLKHGVTDWGVVVDAKERTAQER